MLQYMYPVINTFTMCDRPKFNGRRSFGDSNKAIFTRNSLLQFTHFSCHYMRDLQTLQPLKCCSVMKT